ncbi:hypothetical protein PRIPAC_79830 [Pristionchus pacificus]|uniref:Uncharacterized protein n=1 Tax=Pristionchus pacificus TaxID=54126 RepID=A0A2A6C4P6_PRIPA|nr:hypothetical protein PRIPAC_79830 [Pristionchus pacificus]|eukprot:PDM73001.1 hypothetical protein PRIPAC_39435 [Pristionchus pacificus]
MGSKESSSINFAAQLAQSLPSTNSSDSNLSPTSITGSSNSSTGTGSYTSTRMKEVSNPFYIGNLSSKDQNRLRDAFSRF